MIKGIVALDSSTYGIGVANTLPWRLPSDLAYFKRCTKGHALLMGWNTLISLPGILPGRQHFVIIRESTLSTAQEEQLFKKFGTQAKRVVAVNQVDLAAMLNNCRLSTQPDLWVIGGAKTYADLLPEISELHITEVECTKDLPYDTWFPKIDLNDWDTIAPATTEPGSPADEYTYTTTVLSRAPKPKGI